MSPSDSIADRRRELERRLADLSPAKRALLERAPDRLDQPVPDAATAPTIGPRAPGVPVPMSFVQELVWLLEQVNPGSVYNVSRLARLKGPLDVDALQRALDALVARHEVLRSTFDAVDGEPRQIVHAPRPVHLHRVDLRDDADAEATALALVRDLSRRPFDLASDLQLRATVVALGDADQLLLLESHHVASDEWSRNILLRELATLYAAFRRAPASAGVAPANLPALPIQYGDYALWQRQTLKGPELERLLGYWRERVAGAPAVLELPTDRPRTTMPSFDGALASIEIPAATLDGLRRVSQASGATLFMTLLAAVDVLLARWSGQQDVMVGSPIAGRAHVETHDLMGYFTNMLVLRTQWDGDPTFVELLARVRDVALGAYEHQDLPYEKLVLEIQRQQPDGAPQLQVQFTLQDPGRESFTLDGTTAVPFARLGGVSKLELSLAMLELPSGGLRVLAEYRTDLFEATTVERMLRQLDTLLASIGANPSARVSELALLPAGERATLLDEWNDTAVSVPGPRLLHERIAAQAARTPDAVAVASDLEDGGVATLTFADLHARAATLGRYLRTLGVGPGMGVGLHADRSLELVVGMLGILEAGAYYVPLDPDYPADRVSFMLEDSGVNVLLTVSRVRPASPAGASGPTVVVLDTQWADVETGAAHADVTARAASPEDVAYTIYTSGSTGRPKGVQIPHRAVVNYLAWMQNAYDVGPHDVILQKAPASFDACIWEFFLPLVSGARLVLARPGGQQDPAYLLDVLEQHGITLLQLVPSQLQMMLDLPTVGAPNGLPRLRRLFLGGEALPAELLTRATTACPTVPITNLYGPTECTVYATHWDVAPGTWREGGAVSIGRPVWNTQILLLDPHGQLVPIGAPGELCIGGAQLARGYSNRPELTAEKFGGALIDRGPTEVRLYRTGDRARWRADGTLEYLGRLDFQVKLRGFRIELGEIETLLAAQPEVQSAAALVREDTPGDQRLVAYCLPNDGAATGDHAEHSRALRERLKATLPAFMVPSTIVWLERWPMNANGKLDRKALPAPDASDAPAAATPYRKPETAVEEIVAGVWGEVLGLAQVGTEHDFFDVGGHSLLAMQAASRISRLFGRRVTLRSFFQHSTIRSFAASLAAEETTPGRTDAVARALVKLRDMTPEERERRRAAAASATQKNPGTRDGHE